MAKGLDLISPVIGLSDDQKEFYHLAREFADSEMRPYANKWDQEAIFPVDTYKKTADLGFAGLFIPEEFGGYYIIVFEIIILSVLCIHFILHTLPK